MDAVEKFFAALPNPDADHRHIAQYGAINTDQYSHAIRTFRSFLQSNPMDPDQRLLFSTITECGDFEVLGNEVRFRQQLGKLALSQSLPLPVATWKGRQLEYYRWISQGRKDGDCPLGIDAQRARPQAEVATNAYLPDGPPNTCANCDKGPDGLNRCSACLVQFESRVIASTSYCSKQCQEQHWPQHKKVCAPRKRLWRAVQLIHALFVKFQTYTYNQVLEELTVRDGVLYCVDRSHTECVVTGKSAQQVLTRDRAPSDETFLATLMANKCADIVSVCKPLVDILLEPLRLRIEEMCIIPRNIHTSTCTIPGTDPEDHTLIALGTHNLLRVILPNGEGMAVDFSGAQMGWRETLAPWQVWQDNRALSMGHPNPYGALSQMEGMFVAMSIPDNEGERHRKHVSDLIASEIQGRMHHQGNNANATELFSLDEAQYNSWKDGLLSSVEQRLAADSQKYAQSRVGLQYFDDKWRLQYTLNAAQAGALDGVWLTEDEVKMHGGNEKRLKEIWAERCRSAEKQAQFKALGMRMHFK